MTTTGIPAAGPGGVLRLTWVRDRLAHVLEHCDTDEPSGTWTGRACPDHGLAIGANVDTATLRQLFARGQLADLIWEATADLTAEHSQLFRAAIQAYHAGQAEAAEQIWQQLGTVWSRAWAANLAALELMQDVGLARFFPVKPQRWVVASFKHHCGPHGLPSPHVHNIVFSDLTSPQPPGHAHAPPRRRGDGSRARVSYLDRMPASALRFMRA
jgi:hypothetical protein